MVTLWRTPIRHIVGWSLCPHGQETHGVLSQRDMFYCIDGARVFDQIQQQWENILCVLTTNNADDNIDPLAVRGRADWREKEQSWQKMHSDLLSQENMIIHLSRHGK